MKKLTYACSLVLSVMLLGSCNQKATESKTEAKTEEATPTVEKDEAKSEKESLSQPYNEEEDADEKLNELIAQAKKEGKKVFVQAGGNWCIWCLRFNDFVQKTEELKSIVDKEYVYYHLNYSTKNKNKEVFDKYAPEGKKLGFPFFFVIDQEGKVTNIINSVDLELDKGYDVEKVKQMFLDNAL
ncbi:MULTISPECIES: thioredoxin family protein [Myroides]|uniref:Thioredoxin family protein n=1 Tax=Myroides albus TaxID=2562892 RepID=A0A6I3LR42_9FLAO|nr:MULTISPECIES: thioredoxin family protein [Myroides]MTG98435.1 thioredoxin family protein [Myroides albus]MVX35045.1 thioredoxin family protein [Myroides sp. LoEW2-1]UVD79652.1 thioredoxin family protein [Myroides albus]